MCLFVFTTYIIAENETFVNLGLIMYHIIVMSTTQKIAHNTIVQIIGKVISTLLGLLALSMLTHYLGKEQYGWYTSAITFLQFAGILVDFGMVPVTAQMMSESEFDKKELFKNLLGFRFWTAVTAFSLTVFLVFLFPYTVEIKQAVALLSISFVGIAINQILVGYYQTKLKMHVQAIGESVGRIVLVIGLWLLITGKSSFLPLMGTICISNLVYTVYLWASTAKEIPVGFGYNKTVWKAITKKMWPIAISIVFNIVYLRGDALLLIHYVSQAEIGVYGAAYRVIDIFSQTAMMIMGVILPLLAFSWSRNLKEEFTKQYQQGFDILMLIGIPLTVGTIFTAKKIMVFIAGEEFLASGTILQILILAVFGVFVGAIFGHTAVAINRQKQTLWIYLSCAILTLIGYLYFIPRYGITGAAWMTVFSEVYAGSMLALTIRYYTGIPIQLRTLGKILIAGAVMAIALFLLSPLHVLWLITIGAVVYGGMLYMLNIVSKSTVQEIMALRGKK